MLLAATPFLVFLFASSSKYLRSLKAIIGIEPGAPALLLGFLLLLALFATGFLAARRWTVGDATPRGWWRPRAPRCRCTRSSSC